MVGEKNFIDFIFLPKIIPTDKNKSWNTAVKMGNISEKPEIILNDTPQIKESADMAKPRLIASLLSIVCELSASDRLGSFNMFAKIIQRPMNTSKILPNICGSQLGMKLKMNIPILTEISVIKNEIQNKTNLGFIPIFIFRIP